MNAFNQTHPPGGGPNRQAGGRRPWAGAGMVLALVLVLAGCETILPGIDASAICARRRVNLAYSKYDEARVYLAEHYRLRHDTLLGEAFQISQDSVQLARSSRPCLDFDEVVRRQAIDLIRANILLQRLVMSNMRDQDPGVVVDLYGDRYTEIFKNDIH